MGHPFITNTSDLTVSGTASRSEVGMDRELGVEEALYIERDAVRWQVMGALVGMVTLRLRMRCVMIASGLHRMELTWVWCR